MCLETVSFPHQTCRVISSFSQNLPYKEKLSNPGKNSMLRYRLTLSLLFGARFHIAHNCLKMVKDSLEHLICLLPLPVFCNYRHSPLNLVYAILEAEPRTLCMTAELHAQPYLEVFKYRATISLGDLTIAQVDVGGRDLSFAFLVFCNHFFTILPSGIFGTATVTIFFIKNIEQRIFTSLHYYSACNRQVT